ncbi:hypothetical protein [Brucella anthropi]|uniref:hypothetical protein n=1 Tax=Brucella anthropi TaxID=529 RepID=UPI00124F03D0|nr:hypothetical protein [Brucella anthropi]KAB2747876.1 hypothetical protein F9L05_14650 [Brucella anthropi]
MPRTSAPAHGEAMPKEPLEVARDVFYALDDALGRMESAIRVMDMLTDGTPQNHGMAALFDKHREIDAMVRKAWPIVVRRPGCLVTA